MAWNPSKEVAAARDAAKASNTKIAVIVYLSPDGQNIGMASYGATKELCKHARELGKHLLDAAMKWSE